MVGGETLTFSGDAAADTVLYKSSTVTITLDEQTLLLPPGATGGSIGPSITTDAIDIQLNHAKYGSQTITGNFAIGQSSAGYSLNSACAREPQSPDSIRLKGRGA